MLVMTNVDNITNDKVSHLIQSLIEAGAGNVHVVSALTKKGRPEFLFFIDTCPEGLDAVVDVMARETGTLGLRVLKDEHIRLEYENLPVELSIKNPEGNLVFEGTVNVKVTRSEERKILALRAEHEEVKEILKILQEHGIDTGFDELQQMIETRVTDQYGERPFSLELR